LHKRIKERLQQAPLPFAPSCGTWANDLIITAAANQSQIKAFSRQRGT